MAQSKLLFFIFPIHSMVDLSMVFCSRLPGRVFNHRNPPTGPRSLVATSKKPWFHPQALVAAYVVVQGEGTSCGHLGFLPPTMSTPHVASRATHRICHRICFEDWSIPTRWHHRWGMTNLQQMQVKDNVSQCTLKPMLITLLAIWIY